MNKYRLLLSKIYRFFFPIDEVTKYRRMGVKIGENSYFGSNVTLDYSHYWLITIGKNVKIGPDTLILAHDTSTKDFLGYTRLGAVVINDNVFIGSKSIILPNVLVGEHSIIGAGSVVTKDVPANSVVAGNPAKFICSTDEYYEKVKQKMNKENCFNESYTIRKNISDGKKSEMIETIEKYGCGFVE